MAESIFKDVTVERINAYRDLHGGGTVEALNTLKKVAALRCIGELRQEDTHDPRIVELLEHLILKS